MKKLISKIFFVAFGAVALVGCTSDNNPNEKHFGDDKQSGWLQFPAQNKTYVVSGLVTEFKVPVALFAPVNTDGLTFNYTITDVQGTTAGYLSHTGTGVVPKNSREGYISFNIPAEQQTSCREFLITLTSASRNNVQIGLGANEKPITHSVVIGRGRDSYIGNFSVVEDGSYMYNTSIIAGAQANEIIINRLGDWNPTSQTSAFLAPVSNSPQIVLSNSLLFEDSGLPIFVGDSEIASSYDPCSGNLVIRYALYDEGGEALTNPADPFVNVFTKL